MRELWWGLVADGDDEAVEDHAVVEAGGDE